MYNRLNTKEERLAARAAALVGYTVTEYPDADCVVGIDDSNARPIVKIYDGTAGKPTHFYSFRSRVELDKYVAEHVESRRARLAAADERKKAAKAAGKYQPDMSKPYFEVGREYAYSWGYDGEDYCHIIRVVSRTACFVSYVDVYANREDDEVKRCKVSADENGEYLNAERGFYHFRANKALPTAEEREAMEAERRAEEEAEAERRAAEVKRQIAEGREYILNVAAAYPVAVGEPVVNIGFSENPAFYSFMHNSEQLALSVRAANIILAHFDEQVAAENRGYDKTDFSIEYTDDNGEICTYEGRYDLGDNDGGLIEHIRAFGRYGAEHGEAEGKEIMRFADMLESYTGKAVIVNAEFAPYLPELAGKITAAREEQERREWEELSETIKLLPTEYIKDLARDHAEKNEPELARYWLMELARRDKRLAIDTMHDIGLT